MPSSLLEQGRRLDAEQILAPEASAEPLRAVLTPIALTVPLTIRQEAVAAGADYTTLSSDLILVPEASTEPLRARLIPTTLTVPLAVKQEATATGVAYTTFSSVAAEQEVAPAVLEVVPVYVDIVYATLTEERTPTPPESAGRYASPGVAGFYSMPDLVYSPPFPIFKEFETRQLREVLKI
jgi:hypothetical protein